LRAVDLERLGHVPGRLPVLTKYELDVAERVDHGREPDRRTVRCQEGLRTTEHRYRPVVLLGRRERVGQLEQRCAKGDLITCELAETNALFRDFAGAAISGSDGRESALRQAGLGEAPASPSR
jgi:hypothetical protein